jgi:hypothetical protein
MNEMLSAQYKSTGRLMCSNKNQGNVASEVLWDYINKDRMS